MVQDFHGALLSWDFVRGSGSVFWLAEGVDESRVMGFSSRMLFREQRKNPRSQGGSVGGIDVL